jgi:hypothetical protein
MKLVQARPAGGVEGEFLGAKNGHFQRYKPEFLIAIFNQCLLLAAVGPDVFPRQKMV